MTLIDTHAGAGLYDLALDPRTARSPEWRDGLARAAHAPNPPDSVAAYLKLVSEVNAAQPELRFYPGSPLLAAAMLRPGDALLCVEKHPEERAALEAALGRAGRVIGGDGYAELRAALPPKIRRGLVLIDPPFEQPGELTRMMMALSDGLRRWNTGVFALWRPIKSGDATQNVWDQAKAAAGDAPLLAVEHLVCADDGRKGLIGSGLLIANPPWGLYDALADLGPWLNDALADGQGEWRLQWITEPR